MPGLYHWHLPEVGLFYLPGCLPLAMSFSLSSTGASFLRLPGSVELCASGVLSSPRSFREDAAGEDKLWCTSCSSSFVFPTEKKAKVSNTCIFKLNIKALVRVWGKRGKYYSVSRRGEIKRRSSLVYRYTWI